MVLVGMSHKGLVSALTQAEFVVSTVKSEVEKFNTLALFLSLKSLNQLYDAVRKMESVVDQLQFIFQSGIKK